jgi:hypothetical protein
MDNHPGDSRADAVVFGPRDHAFLRYARRIPGPRRRRWLVGISAAVVGSLVALALVLGATRAPVARSRPASIQIINENYVEFTVRGGATVVLEVEYLRAGNGPVTTWLTFAVTGLPEGYEYVARAGVCVHGRAISVGSATGGVAMGDAHILELSVGDLHVYPADRRLWVRMAPASPLIGPDMGGFRGPFFPPGLGHPIAPGQSAC